MNNGFLIRKGYIVGKQVDTNGFWKIEDNPLSKVGVFPYLGKQISDSLEPEKVYMVLRPSKELFNQETIDSFNLVPLVNDHEMIGEGYTPAEDKGIDGVISNVKAKDNVLVGDIKIFSESMKDDIKSGKKELSMGYTCSYEVTDGVWNGEKYDAIQRDIRGNHVALVDKGRMGSDVRVYDRKLAFDTIAIDISVKELVQEFREGDEEMNKKDKRKAIDEELEKKPETIEDEEEVEDQEESEETEDESESNETSEDGEEETEDEEEIESEDSDEEEAEDQEEETLANDKCVKDSSVALKKAVDGMSVKIMRMLDERESLVKKVTPLIGTFNHSKMTVDQVARYACDKLSIPTKNRNIRSALDGYLFAVNKIKKPVVGFDSVKPQFPIRDKGIEKYLRGE